MDAERYMKVENEQEMHYISSILNSKNDNNLALAAELGATDLASRV